MWPADPLLNRDIRDTAGMIPSRSTDLATFRAHLYHCLGPRRDALFDLVDALSVAGPRPSLAHLSLAAPHRRGWAEFGRAHNFWR
jgi:hypothetical protein